MSSSQDVLPRGGFVAHSEQSDEAALEAGAWGITTELVSGIVVMSRIEHSLGMYRVHVFEKGDMGPAIIRHYATPDAAKHNHYSYVALLVGYGRIIHDPGL